MSIHFANPKMFLKSISSQLLFGETRRKSAKLMKEKEKNIKEEKR